MGNFYRRTIKAERWEHLEASGRENSKHQGSEMGTCLHFGGKKVVKVAAAQYIWVRGKR